MDAMELIAFKADPAALSTGMALPGGDRGARGLRDPAPFDAFADILAASEATRRRGEEPQPRKFDETGLDDLEEESLRRRHAERRLEARLAPPPLPALLEQPATVTQFLPQELQPQGTDGALPAAGLQDRLLASTAGAALTAPIQAAAAQSADGTNPGTALQQALAGMEGRTALRQDSMADGAAQRLDKRELLVQPAAPAGLSGLVGKGNAPGNLILATSGQEGSQGQAGQQGGQGGAQSNGGQNGQSPAQLLNTLSQAQADPAAMQARAEQFAGVMAQQGRGGQAVAGQAGQPPVGPANPGQPAMGADGLRAEVPGQVGSGQAGTATGTGQAGLAPVDPAGRTEAARQPQAPQMARAAVPQPPVEQVAIRIATLARGGMDMIRIQLEPADLGRVDVRLQMMGGEVTATVTADRQETLDLLQRDSRALQQALQEAGLKTSGEGLSFSLRDNGREAPADRDGLPRDLAANGRAADEAAALAAAAAAQPQWRSDRALDILA